MLDQNALIAAWRTECQRGPTTSERHWARDWICCPKKGSRSSLTPYGISEVLTPPAVRACPGQRGRRRLVWVRACQRDGIDSAASGPDSDAWVAQSAAAPRGNCRITRIAGHAAGHRGQDGKCNRYMKRTPSEQMLTVTYSFGGRGLLMNSRR